MTSRRCFRCFFGSTRHPRPALRRLLLPEGQGPRPVSRAWHRGHEPGRRTAGVRRSAPPGRPDAHGRARRLARAPRPRRAPRRARSDGAPAPRLRAPLLRRQRSNLADRPITGPRPGRPADTRVRLDRGAPRPQHRRVLRDPSGGSGRGLPNRSRRCPVGAVLRRSAHRAGPPSTRPLAEAGARWSALEALVAGRGRPDRLVIALQQSIFTGVDRASYTAEAEVSAPTASNDLRRLLDAGLVVQRGKGAQHTLRRVRGPARRSPATARESTSPSA